MLLVRRISQVLFKRYEESSEQDVTGCTLEVPVLFDHGIAKFGKRLKLGVIRVSSRICHRTLVVSCLIRFCCVKDQFEFCCVGMLPNCFADDSLNFFTHSTDNYTLLSKILCCLALLKHRTSVDWFKLHDFDCNFCTVTCGRCVLRLHRERNRCANWNIERYATPLHRCF